MTNDIRIKNASAPRAPMTKTRHAIVVIRTPRQSGTVETPRRAARRVHAEYNASGGISMPWESDGSVHQSRAKLASTDQYKSPTKTAIVLHCKRTLTFGIVRVFPKRVAMIIYLAFLQKDGQFPGAEVCVGCTTLANTGGNPAAGTHGLFWTAWLGVQPSVIVEWRQTCLERKLSLGSELAGWRYE